MSVKKVCESVKRDVLINLRDFISCILAFHIAMNGAIICTALKFHVTDTCLIQFTKTKHWCIEASYQKVYLHELLAEKGPRAETVVF